MPLIKSPLNRTTVSSVRESVFFDDGSEAKSLAGTISSRAELRRTRAMSLLRSLWR